MTGRKLSHYEITEKLGEGGMGVVYKAKDTHLDRFVAIKLLPAEKVADPERKRRFVQEAKAASALNHPNIVHVYDIDQQDGLDYIAMEYVEGKTLSQLIGRKGLKLGEALKYGVQIADALGRAHAAGIVHRDLKPANIMVDEHGLVKVLDFGLAKLTETALPGEDESTRTVKPTTEEGTIVGTVAYMSPEQAEGKRLDARSDIFSFGAVLYEMLTGSRAFQKDSKTSTLAAILTQEPPPLGGEIPRDVEKVVARCLRKDVARRYQHMDDVKVTLEELKEESDSGKLTSAQVPARQRNRRFLRPVLAVAAILVLAAGSVFLWQRIEAKPLTDKDVLVLADFTNTTGDTVFDVTLREALAVQLEQSPFLKIMGDEQMRQNLRLMGGPARERITSQVAWAICQREGEKATIGGSIATLGETYAITLQATNCQTGEVLAREQVEANGKEHVLRAVATAAEGMRAKLGESLASIRKLDVPTQRPTTTSLEAFQAFALGEAQRTSGLWLAAVLGYQRAAQLDPNFASAHLWLGIMYHNVGETERGSGQAKLAFQLLDRVSEQERLDISSWYYYASTGELDKATTAAQLFVRGYPRDQVPHHRLGFIYEQSGEYEKALQEYQAAVRLEPRWALSYGNQVGVYTSLNRLDEAKAVAEDMRARKLGYAFLPVALLRIAQIQGDRAEAEKHIQSLAGKPEEPDGLVLQAANAAALGQLRRAEELLGRAAEGARMQSLPETAARFLALEALNGALAGTLKASCLKARAAVLSEQAPADSAVAGLALALCGDTAAAQKVADETSKRYPVHTIWNAIQLRSIQAAIELDRDRPLRAIELLSSAAPYERAYAYAVYLRGLAYLRARKGAEAAVEFQKILEHKGATWGPYYPLSYVGLARAAAFTGDSARARKAYQDFLALWKDADPDIPILKEAKEEYAKLK